MTETFHAGPNLGRLSDVTIIHGDCIEAMAELPADSVDAIVTDPPYGLGFMGKAWDDLPPGIDWAKQCYRVLKPGGHLLAFGGTRTWHRLAVAVEDAGFEIRDSIAWLYGSGFPKSLDVSKAIDKAAGATREVVGAGAPFGAGSMRNRSRVEQGYRPTELNPDGGTATVTAPATPEAEQRSGWGTALKPAFEPVVVARKPLGGFVRTVCSNCQGEGDTYERACLECDGSGYVKRQVGSTVAANVLAHGTGALNIDSCRIGTAPGDDIYAKNPNTKGGFGHAGASVYGSSDGAPTYDPSAGRWPANVVLDADQAAALDEQSGFSTSPSKPVKQGGVVGFDPGENAGIKPRNGFGVGYGDKGGASRFFYCAKAPKKERPTYVDAEGKQQSHATVKPLALMRWLVRLVTPPGGVVLDPFAGSGTTVEAALLEDFRVIGIERETDYLPMIQQRIARCLIS